MNRQTNVIQNKIKSRGKRNKNTSGLSKKLKVKGGDPGGACVGGDV